MLQHVIQRLGNKNCPVVINDEDFTNEFGVTHSVLLANAMHRNLKELGIENKFVALRTNTGLTIQVLNTFTLDGDKWHFIDAYGIANDIESVVARLEAILTNVSCHIFELCDGSPLWDDYMDLLQLAKPVSSARMPDFNATLILRYTTLACREEAREAA